MARIGTKRRRVRRLDPAVLQAIHEDLATGASAPRVLDALVERQAAGTLPEEALLPSERTLRNIARDMAHDDSGPWTLEDASPSEARLVLRVLSAVANKSHDRVQHLTKREAHLAAVYLTVRPGIKGSKPQGQAWAAYVWVRGYLAQLTRGEDLAKEHRHLEALAAIDEGLEYRPGMIDPMLKEQGS